MKRKTETISEALRRRLLACGESQETIAAQCGIGQATVSRLMTGKTEPRMKTLEILTVWLDKREKQAAKKAARRVKSAL